MAELVKQSLEPIVEHLARMVESCANEQSRQVLKGVAQQLAKNRALLEKEVAFLNRCLISLYFVKRPASGAPLFKVRKACKGRDRGPREAAGGDRGGESGGRRRPRRDERPSRGLSGLPRSGAWRGSRRVN